MFEVVRSIRSGGDVKMSHAYKHFVVPSSRSVPLWRWIFALVAISVFASLLFYLDRYEKGMLKEDHQISIKKIFSTVTDGIKEIKEIKKINILEPQEKKSNDKKNTAFEFYQMLPASKVTVPEHETSRFYLQAGSFKNYKTADRMKAKLALIGIVSIIESITLKDTGRWHRVRAGPFAGTREINRVRSVMRDNDIEPIMVKVKT